MIERSDEAPVYRLVGRIWRGGREEIREFETTSKEEAEQRLEAFCKYLDEKRLRGTVQLIPPGCPQELSDRIQAILGEGL